MDSTASARLDATSTGGGPRAQHDRGAALRDLAGSRLEIRQPSDLEPVGQALSALNIGFTLVDRLLRVVWANDFIGSAASSVICGSTHCFAALWGSKSRCPDCLPLLTFSTGEAQDGFRERAAHGAAPESYSVRALPVFDPDGQLLWVAECVIHLPSLLPRTTLVTDAASATGIAVIVIDNQERIVSWNQGAEEVFGYRVDEVLGRRIDLLLPDDRVEEERSIASAAARNGTVPRRESVRKARDGRLVPVAVSAVGLLDEGGNLMGRTCLLEDLSSLQKLRSLAASQQQLLAHITREAADAIIAIDRKGTITSWNRAAETLLGYRADAVLGRSLSVISNEADVADLLSRARDAGGLPGFRMDWRNSKGQPVPVDLSAAWLTGTGEEPVSIALVARDLSARLRLERQMMRSEKLAVVGSLAAGLAHEIGTPLNVISATAEYLLLDSRADQDQEQLRHIVAETDRISRRVRELLSFARGTERGRCLVRVADAISRALTLLRVGVARKHVTIQTDLSSDLPAILADPDGVHEVFVNLLINAVAVVEPGGKVMLRCTSLRLAGGEEAVSVEVHDDGPGVPDELKERVFDPFFTTRPDGTGLGLAVCARVVSEHGGDIRVTTSELGGACFVVQLPTTSAEAPR